MSTTVNSSNTPTKKARNKIPLCGTYGGYNHHVKNKTEVCQPCRDARNEYRSKYYKAHPDKKRSMDVRYLERHPGQRAKYDQKYRDNNRTKTREASLSWNKSNPERMNAASRKRRALKLKNGHTPYTEPQVIDLYGTVCYLCDQQIDLQAARRVGKEGWELGLHIDHVVPIVSGGPDTLENVRPTHALCNLRKNSTSIERTAMTDETTTPAEDAVVDAPVEETPAEDTFEDLAADEEEASEDLDDEDFDDEFDDLDDEDDEEDAE